MPFLSLVSRHANLWNRQHSFSFAMGENSELLAVNEIHLLLNWEKKSFLNAVILCLKSKRRKKKQVYYAIHNSSTTREALFETLHFHLHCAPQIWT